MVTLMLHIISRRWWNNIKRTTFTEPHNAMHCWLKNIQNSAITTRQNFFLPKFATIWILVFVFRVQLGGQSSKAVLMRYFPSEWQFGPGHRAMQCRAYAVISNFWPSDPGPSSPTHSGQFKFLQQVKGWIQTCYWHFCESHKERRVVLLELI